MGECLHIVYDKEGREILREVMPNHGTGYEEALDFAQPDDTPAKGDIWEYRSSLGDFEW